MGGKKLVLKDYKKCLCGYSFVKTLYRRNNFQPYCSLCECRKEDSKMYLVGCARGTKVRFCKFCEYKPNNHDCNVATQSGNRTKIYVKEEDKDGNYLY